MIIHCERANPSPRGLTFSLFPLLRFEINGSGIEGPHLTHLNQARSPLGIRNRPNTHPPRDDDDDDGEKIESIGEREEGKGREDEKESSRSRDISRISYNL